jgi:nondiscriminating aspartyl-tRNA synthetase
LKLPTLLPTRTLCADLQAAQPGADVLLQGWVHRRRTLASLTFLVIRDRSGLAQVVVREPEALAVVAGTPEETVVQVIGTLTANPSAPGGIEVTSPTIKPLSAAAATPPVELWRPSLAASLPVLLDGAPVTWRHPAQRAKWQLAAASLRGFRATLDAAAFTEIHTPKFVASATESGANVFEVDYFGRPAFLAQSPQFYKQQMVGVFERVYEVGPVFRAEPHDTVRHLAEYVSLDVEMGFINSHRDVLAQLRDVLAGMVEAIHEYAPGAAQASGAQVPSVPEQIPVIHFADALRLVGAPDDEPDLAPEHERALGAWAKAEHGSDFLAVEGYPMAKRPFYTHPWTGEQQGSPRESGAIADCAAAKWSNSFDLLFRGLELVTGGQRLHEASAYHAAISARGEDPAAYAAYLQAFEHGMPPHGGFAIGLERWAARLVEAANIREVTLFPRDLHRLSP